MSTLRVTNVQDTAGANSLTTAQIYNGAAKAWVNFNGTGTVAIRASFNVSSITDNGTGDYTVNFTTALVDANYSVSGTGGSGSSSGTVFMSPRGADPTASSVRLYALNASDILQDTVFNSVAVFR
jgi:hypothetical protein